MKELNKKSTDYLFLLQESELFKQTDIKTLEKIILKSKYYKSKENEIIFDLGDDAFSGIILLIHGKIKTFTNQEKPAEIVNEILKGDIFNILSIFHEDLRSFAATSVEESEFLFIPKDVLENICQTDKIFHNNLHKKITLEFNKHKLEKILANFYSKEVDNNILKELMNSGEWINLKDNTKLFEFGEQSDSIFFLIRGFLKAFIPNKSELQEVGEIKEGEVIGEMGLLSDEPRSASIYSTRESLLFKITKDKFDNLMLKNPSVLFALSKQIILRFKKNQNLKNENENTIFLNLLHTSKNLDNSIVNSNFGKSMEKALNKYEKAYYLNKTIVEEVLSIKNINKTLESDGKSFILDDFINKISKDYKYIILDSEINNTPWTTWCTTLSDKYLFLLNPSLGIDNDEIINLMNNIQSDTPNHLMVDRQLIICHDNKNIFPSGTIEHLNALDPVSIHYHINIKQENDFLRLARMITNKSVGLAFGGGGARALAHIGVYKAILEKNIPIDVVCGTSAGSMMAAIIASGYSVDEVEEIWEKFSKDIKITLSDYNLPHSSVWNGENLYNSYFKIFENRRIEDLWLPMFGCAANITSAELEVIDRGKIWRAVRASSSLPGALSPVIENNSLFVDGGLMNNLPGNILKEKYNSKIISINVSPEVELEPKFEKFPNQNNLFLKKLFLNKRYRAEYGHLNIPTLGEIMIRSIMTGSANKTKEVAEMSEIFFDVPTNGYSMTDFIGAKSLIKKGYDYARERLNNYDLSETLGI